MDVELHRTARCAQAPPARVHPSLAHPCATKAVHPRAPLWVPQQRRTQVEVAHQHANRRVIQRAATAAPRAQTLHLRSLRRHAVLRARNQTPASAAWTTCLHHPQTSGMKTLSARINPSADPTAASVSCVLKVPGFAIFRPVASRLVHIGASVHCGAPPARAKSLRDQAHGHCSNVRPPIARPDSPQPADYKPQIVSA